MSENNNILPDKFREIVYSNDEIVPDDIREIRNNQIITFYSQMFEYAESEKEVWDIMSIFMRIHKDDKKVVEEVVLICENHLSTKKLNSSDK